MIVRHGRGWPSHTIRGESYIGVATHKASHSTSTKNGGSAPNSRRARKADSVRSSGDTPLMALSPREMWEETVTVTGDHASSGNRDWTCRLADGRVPSQRASRPAMEPFGAAPQCTCGSGGHDCSILHRPRRHRWTKQLASPPYNIAYKDLFTNVSAVPSSRLVQ